MMGSREVVTPSATSSTGLVVFREIEVGNSSRAIASSAPCLCVDDMSSTEGRDLQSGPFPSMDRSKASTLRRTISLPVEVYDPNLTPISTIRSASEPSRKLSGCEVGNPSTDIANLEGCKFWKDKVTREL